MCGLSSRNADHGCIVPASSRNRVIMMQGLFRGPERAARLEDPDVSVL